MLLHRLILCPQTGVSPIIPVTDEIATALATEPWPHNGPTPYITFGQLRHFDHLNEKEYETYGALLAQVKQASKIGVCLTSFGLHLPPLSIDPRIEIILITDPIDGIYVPAVKGGKTRKKDISNLIITEEMYIMVDSTDSIFDS